VGTLGAVKIWRNLKGIAAFRLDVKVTIRLYETFRIQNGTTVIKTKNWPWVWYENPSLRWAEKRRIFASYVQLTEPVQYKININWPKFQRCRA
jgi:hypothetical protein